jgi:S1-C subfamily serine protease
LSPEPPRASTAWSGPPVAADGQDDVSRLLLRLDVLGRVDHLLERVALGSAASICAVPINKAMQFIPQIQSGRSTSALYVGATRALPCVGAEDTQNGVHVDCVETGSPAATAGITVGSIITALNGSTVDTNSTLGNDIVQLDPGSSVAVTWIDTSGASHTTTVVLTTGPPA